MVSQDKNTNYTSRGGKMETPYAALNPFLVGNATSEILDGIDDDLSLGEDPLSLSSANDYTSDEDYSEWDEVGSLSKDKDDPSTGGSKKKSGLSIYSAFGLGDSGRDTFKQSQSQSKVVYYAHKALIFKIVFGLCLFIMMSGLALRQPQDDEPHSNDYLRTSSQDEELEIVEMNWEGEPIDGTGGSAKDDDADQQLAEEAEEAEEAERTDDDLPEGWKMYTDTKSGRPYYADPNGKTTWHLPDVEKQGEGVSQYGVGKSNADDNDGKSAGGTGTESSSSSSKTKEDNLPEGWKATVDKKSGKTNYYNTKDKTTTWTKPSANVEGGASRRQDKHESQQPTASPTSSTKTSENEEPTTWKKPSANVEGGASESHDQPDSQQLTATTKSAAKSADKDDQLPEGWKAALDQKSGKTYYYNTKDKRTTWKRPSA